MLSLAQTIAIDELSAIITLLCLCSWQRLVVCVILDGRVTENLITICSYSEELPGSRWVIRIMCWWVLKFRWQTVIQLDCNLVRRAGYSTLITCRVFHPDSDFLLFSKQPRGRLQANQQHFTSADNASHPDSHSKIDLLELLQKNYSVVSHSTQSGVCFHFTICTRKLYSDWLFELYLFFFG